MPTAQCCHYRKKIIFFWAEVILVGTRLMKPCKLQKIPAWYGLMSFVYLGLLMQMDVHRADGRRNLHCMISCSGNFKGLWVTQFKSYIVAKV